MVSSELLFIHQLVINLTSDLGEQREGLLTVKTVHSLMLYGACLHVHTYYYVIKKY